MFQRKSILKICFFFLFVFIFLHPENISAAEVPCGEPGSDCGGSGGGSGPICGNGSCEAGESCSTCSQDCGSCCTPSYPSAPSPYAPSNGATVNSLTPTLYWNMYGTFGTGCPQINAFRVFLSSNCSSFSDISGALNESIRSFTIPSGILQWNRTYCWYVIATNNSYGAQSSTFRFTTQQGSMLTSDTVTGDVCGNGISGRPDQSNVSNPVTFNFSFSQAPSSSFVEARLALLPASGPFAENRDVVDYATIQNKVISSQSFAARYNLSDSTAQILLPNGPSYSWSSPSSSGSLSNGFNNSSLLNINIDSFATSSTNWNAQFNVRFENSFPSGVYNLYAYVLYNNGSNTLTAYGSPGVYNYKKLSTVWVVDMDAPSASISSPTAYETNLFGVNWSATDTNGIQNVFSYIYSDTNGATIRDRTNPSTPFDIVTDGNPKSYPADTPNAGINTLNLGEHLYSDLTPSLNAQYVFRLYAQDNACNISETSRSVSISDPWVLSYDNTISVNSGFNSLSIPEVSNFTVPFTSDTSGPFLNNFATISGNSNTPALRNSKINAYSINYLNLATSLPPDSSFSSWFNYLLNLVSLNSPSSIVNFNVPNNSVSGNLSQIFNVSPNSKYVLIQSNSLDLNLLSNSVCDIKALIFLSGNLSIQPDLTKSNPSNGCIFITAGNTLIGKGSDKTSASLSDSNPAQYDIVEAGIITNNLDIPVDAIGGATAEYNKWDGIYIFGLVYSSNLSLNRDLNSFANNLQPAHMFRFDPSLLINFQNDLAKRSFSIREFVK
ncbi:MAG: hypothetical protein KatS3mg085_822 [Candidatus Dojkabacteria bacterium]|nr:MAG: hypothetical protein KatS3mg085_822 [Candidatus Dojkabacteria bacterium]GIW58787.1 MAG: hypothetical protein KatS3mg086_072 [Candidatus Dojkabacteria bacterium]